MAVEFTTTPTHSAAHARVYDSDGNGFRIEAVEEAPDFAQILDTIEDELLEAVMTGKQVNTKDLATALIAKAKREILGELLVRLLCILSESDNVRLDIECMISGAGLKIRDIPDSAVADEFVISRQNFSARRKRLMQKLGLTPPPHSKSLRACETYRQTNRRNGNFNDE